MVADLDEGRHWKYTEFGSAFERKYKYLRAVARKDSRFPEKGSWWWQEQKISEPLRIATSQWSNLRSQNPNKHALIYPWQLHELAKVFMLHELIGRRAWKVFTPEVSFEDFVEALENAKIGSYDPVKAADGSTGSFVLPKAGGYILKCPATLEQYDQTVRLTRELFHQDVVDLDADREAFLRNPYSMVVLVDLKSNQTLGWTDIYHLPDGDIESMIDDGELRIDPDRIIGFPESCKARRAYTASIAINKNRRGLLPFLIYGMMEFLLRFQFDGTEDFELFAIGENDDGIGLLERLKFTFVRTMRMEAGPRGLYSLKLSKQELVLEQQMVWHRLGLYRTDVELQIGFPPALRDGEKRQ